MPCWPSDPTVGRISLNYTGRVTSSEAEGVFIIQIPADTKSFPAVFRLVMAGLVNPPTEVTLQTSSANESIANSYSQWRVVSPGVWDLISPISWALRGSYVVAGGKVFVKYVGRTGATAAAVGTLAADAASNIGPTQLISAMIMPFRPVRFEAMFSGAVTGGAIFHIAYYSAASSTTKIVRLLFHLVFTKFGPADTPVVLTAYLPNISSENLTFKCPLTSPIKGVFTCKTTVEYDSTAVPAAVGKLRLFDALGTVASTSVNLTPRFNLTINGQNEPAYYGPP
ncbi:unnamed protein product [Closterium sp. NIES-54]